MAEYMEDCIHLKACRRYGKIVRSETNNNVPRGCNEHCNAYCSGNTGSYVDTEIAIGYARDGVSSVQAGYGAYDVYCHHDLGGLTISEIIEKESGKSGK